MIPPAVDPSAQIRARLPLTPVPDFPEIALHLAAPTSGLSEIADVTPYWAYLWAGGLALARHLVDQPGLVAGRRVLDLGAGSGVVGIVAAKLGARVQAVEPDRLGRIATGLNAAANGVRIDLLDGVPAQKIPAVDLILAGDVFYDRAAAASVIAFLDAAALAGVPCLIGDPGRAPLPLHRMDAIASFQVPDFGTAGRVTGWVYRLLPPV